MNRLLTSAGTVFAAAAFAFGLAPSAGAAMTAADPVASNVTHVQLPTRMAHNPGCDDEYCVVPSPSSPSSSFKRIHRGTYDAKRGAWCHYELVNNSAPSDPDRAYAWEKKRVCEPASR